MRFVQDGEDTACLANIQWVSTPLPDEVAGPARRADIARAATVVADGRAHAIPVPAEAREGRLGLWRYREARSRARGNCGQAIEGGLRLGRARR
jgi:hypothetical protein